jgi:hypothetical protein
MPFQMRLKTTYLLITQSKHAIAYLNPLSKYPKGLLKLPYK